MGEVKSIIHAPGGIEQEIQMTTLMEKIYWWRMRRSFRKYMKANRKAAMKGVKV